MFENVPPGLGDLTRGQRWHVDRKPRATQLLLVGVLVLSFALYVGHLPDKFSDFRAFYCAGQVDRGGRDPYREHPLRECELRVALPGLPNAQRGATVPAPFPGFVLLLFCALAFVPFPLAFAVWSLAACAALWWTVRLVARTSNVPLNAAIIAIGFPATIVALPLGQVTPFMLLALAGTAALLQADRPRCAAIVSLGALLDPHVGIALWLALFVAVRRTRGVLVAGAAVLFVSGLARAGVGREREYLQAVIPAHALANVTDPAQFSATHFAYLAGFTPRVAVDLGTFWYATALVVGVLAAIRLRGRFGPVAVVYVPAAVAVFGGTHTHLQQLALAIPGFLLVTASATGVRRDFCAIVTFIAAMPWLFLGPSPWLCFAAPLLALIFAREMGSERQAFRLAAASFVTIAIIFITILRTHVARPLFAPAVSGNPLAEVSWQLATVAQNVPTESWPLVAKAPTVLAFIALFFVIGRLALGPSAVPR